MRTQVFTAVVCGLLLCGWFAPSARCVGVDSLMMKSIGGPEGLERLETLKSMYINGRLVLNGMPGDMTMAFVMPDKILMQVDFGVLKMTQGYDGTTAWAMDHNGAVSELSGYQKEELLNQLYLQTGASLFPERMPGGCEYRGLVERDGETFHQVDIYPFGEDTIHAFLDTATGYQEQTVSYMDNLEIVTVTEDFRSVEGLVVGFVANSEAVGAPLKTQTTIEQIVLDTVLDPAIFSRPDKQLDDFRFPPEQDSVVVSFVLDHGHIYIPVTINGRKRVRLILDSGASANIFNKDAVDDLGLEVIGMLPAKGVAGYGEVELLKTDSIQIGDLRLLGQVGGSMDLAMVGRAIGGDSFGGVLGFDFLSRFPIKIDYEAQALTVYRPSSFTAPEGLFEVPFRMTMNIPTVTATTDGISGDFIVDLGNAYGIVLHEDFYDNSELAERLVVDTTRKGILGGVGGAVANQVAVAESFAVGDLSVGPVDVIITGGGSGLTGSSEIAGNIGNRFWRQYGILLDYAGSRLWIYPPRADDQ